MSRKEKLLARIQQRPKDFTWEELKALLRSFGYVESKKGKTGGSRRRFIHETAATITFHKPHPDKTVKRYVIDQIIEFLKQEEML